VLPKSRGSFAPRKGSTLEREKDKVAVLCGVYQGALNDPATVPRDPHSWGDPQAGMVAPAPPAVSRASGPIPPPPPPPRGGAPPPRGGGSSRG